MSKFIVPRVDTNEILSRAGWILVIHCNNSVLRAELARTSTSFILSSTIIQVCLWCQALAEAVLRIPTSFLMS